MTWLTAEFQALIVVSVMFFISLIGAYTLFHVLKSFAFVKTAGHKAGGALAGFLILFSLLSGSYYKVVEAQDSAEHWTIVGQYQAQLAGQGKMIEVHIIPPAPRDMLPAAGREFRLENVQLTQRQVSDGIWPELEFSADGLLPLTVLPSKDDVHIDWARKRLVIKKLVRLSIADSAAEVRDLEGPLDAESELWADARSAIEK